MGKGGLSRVLAVATNTFRETAREKVFYNLVLFAMLMTLSGLLLAKLSIRQQEKIIKDVGLACMDFFGTVIALYMGVGLVSKEIERRSLYPLLAKPLSRSEFFLGKFLGLGLTLLVNVGVMTIGLSLTLWASRSRVSLGLLEGVYPIYLSLLLVVALALLFSTVTSSAMASLVTLCLFVAGRFSDVVLNMRQIAPAVPAWLVSAVYYALPNFRNFDFKDQVAYGDPISLTALGGVTLYAALYVGLALVLGLLAFESRDLA
jgi:ABC-type transport system involved in multi-copper enzyme maturation permease subunit